MGEAIVFRSVTLIVYIFDKTTEKIVSKEVNSQDWKIVRDPRGGDKHVSVPIADRKDQKMSDSEIIELAKLGKKIEQHYNAPQDTEFAIAGGKIYMVQSRPITTLDKSQVESEKSNVQGSESVEANQAEVLLRGAAASLGVATGPVKVYIITKRSIR